jgi:hypothetical protein
MLISARFGVKAEKCVRQSGLFEIQAEAYSQWPAM